MTIYILVLLFSFVVGPTSASEQTVPSPKCGVFMGSGAPGTGLVEVTDGQFLYMVGNYAPTETLTEKLYHPIQKAGMPVTAILMPLPGKKDEFFEVWGAGGDGRWNTQGEIMGYHHYPKGQLPKELADKFAQLRKFASGCRSLVKW